AAKEVQADAGAAQDVFYDVGSFVGDKLDDDVFQGNLCAGVAVHVGDPAHAAQVATAVIAVGDLAPCPAWIGDGDAGGRCAAARNAAKGEAADASRLLDTPIGEP